MHLKTATVYLDIIINKSFKKLKIFKLFVCVHGYVHMSAGAQGGAVGPPAAGVTGAYGCLWVRETELRSSARTAHS